MCTTHINLNSSNIHWTVSCAVSNMDASVSLVWSSYRKALWNTTVGLNIFGAHLWQFRFHYSHIVRVIAREQLAIWCIITKKWCQEVEKSWKYFLSLWQGLSAFCSFRYTNSFPRQKLFGCVLQDCLRLKTAVIQSGLLLHILMNCA